MYGSAVASSAVKVAAPINHKTGHEHSTRLVACLLAGP